MNKSTAGDEIVCAKKAKTVFNTFPSVRLSHEGNGIAPDKKLACVNITRNIAMILNSSMLEFLAEIFVVFAIVIV